MKDYSFGNYICALRTGLGLSQFQLGALVGVTDKAVSKWENGDAKPRIATCYRLAEILGVSINELLSCQPYSVIPARKELSKMNRILWKESYTRLSVYGENPPAECWSRLAAEEAALGGTDAIQGFAVLGKIAEEAQRNHSVIIVGGAINSSFAAWLFGATVVNPLQPHYRCPKCGKTVFVPGVADGFDLLPKKCTCGEAYGRDGHGIPYDGYAKAEQNGTYVEVRVSEKFAPVAVGVLKDFYKGIAEILPIKLMSEDHSWSFDRYVVLPKAKKKPALADDGFWHTTVEDFRQWHEGEISYSFFVNDRLNEIQRLQALTKVDFSDFQKHVNAKMAEMLYQKRCQTIPFITEYLKKEEVHDFDLLIRLDGLSHATGAWEDNGKRLYQTQKANFQDIPATREDIWNAVDKALAKKDIRDNSLALQVMEEARKGHYYSQGIPENLRQVLYALGLPDWYCDYLENVQYLFPKGHCVAYLVADMVSALLAQRKQQ